MRSEARKVCIYRSDTLALQLGRIDGLIGKGTDLFLQEETERTEDGEIRGVGEAQERCAGGAMCGGFCGTEVWMHDRLGRRSQSDVGCAASDE